MTRRPRWMPSARRRNDSRAAGGAAGQGHGLADGRPLRQDEKRLREIYDNYRSISRQKTVVGGLPAVEYRYRGMADDHDWSGTLVVIARGSDIFTVLGMTYADTDLIQIQENVIAKSIASLNFNVH